MLEFFRDDPEFKASVGRLLARMCQSKQALVWLVRTMVDKVGKWHGPTELRGVYCTRYRPSDGVEGTATIGEFAPAAQESRLIEHRPCRQIDSGEKSEPFSDVEMDAMFKVAMAQQRAKAKVAFGRGGGRRWDGRAGGN